jgi:hypothetical protein
MSSYRAFYVTPFLNSELPRVVHMKTLRNAGRPYMWC